MSDFDELLSFFPFLEEEEEEERGYEMGKSGIKMQQKQGSCSERQGISLYFVL